MPLRAAKRPRPFVQPREGYRAVGRVERPWGLRGHVKVLPLTDFPERLAVGARVFIAGTPREVVDSRWQKGRAYVLMQGIADTEAAEALRGALLEIPDDEHPHFAADEFYVDDIEGCAVRTLTGELLGTVREVLQPGANDVYVVSRPGKRDLLIPAVRDVVRRVDPKARTVTVDLPDGLDPDAED